jgi:hypothetical protein
MLQLQPFENTVVDLSGKVFEYAMRQPSFMGCAIPNRVPSVAFGFPWCFGKAWNLVRAVRHRMWRSRQRSSSKGDRLLYSYTVELYTVGITDGNVVNRREWIRRVPRIYIRNRSRSRTTFVASQKQALHV